MVASVADAQHGNQPDRPTAALRLLLARRLLPALGVTKEGIVEQNHLGVLRNADVTE